MGLLVNKEYVNDLMPRLNEKIQWWEERLGNVKFDKFGRAEIAVVESANEHSLTDEVLNPQWSRIYRDAFAEYMAENEYKYIRDYEGHYVDNMYTGYYLSAKDFLNDKLYFKKANDKLVSVKPSRVLARVHAIWCTKVPLYQLTMDGIKELRKAGHTYANSYDLQKLTADKTSLEYGNMSVLYEKFLNANKGGSRMLLSVNPLDKLTSSGGNGSLTPTKFSSCWSLTASYYDDGIRFGEDGCYSDADGCVAIGSVINCAMVMIVNGETLQVPNSDFAFYGYKERSHVWLDQCGFESSLWVEKMYPTKSSSRRDEIMRILADTLLIRITKHENVNSICEFDIQDTEYLREYARNTRKGLFFDRIAIDEGDNYKLVYLPKDRMEYDYENGSWLPEGTREDRNYVECCHCGDRFDFDNGGSVIDDNYVCDNCRDEYYSYCEHCGNYIGNDDTVEVDGDWMCRYCAEDRAMRCERCGDWHYNDNMTMVHDMHGYEIYVCDDCRDDKYVYCDECGEYHYYTKINEYDGRNICDDCYSNVIRECKDCGEEHHITNMEEIDGGWVCDSCVTKRQIASTCNRCDGTGLISQNVFDSDGCGTKVHCTKCCAKNKCR